MADPNRTILTDSDVTRAGPLKDALDAKADAPVTPEGIGAFPAVGGRYDGHADEATTPGTYWLVGSSFTEALGYPVPVTGNSAMLTVKSAVAYTEQTVVTNMGEMWTRMDWGGWQPWRQIGPNTLYGTGQPEGVTIAPVGTEYIDTAATAGARKWYKKSGIGTAGWIVTEGDTGWREYPPMSGWTGRLLFRRVDYTVHIVAMDLDGALAENANIDNSVPLGFRAGPLFPVYGVGSRTSTNGTVGADGGIGLTGGGSNQILRASGSTSGWTGGSASMTYTTTEAWPTSLPGTPA